MTASVFSAPPPSRRDQILALYPSCALVAAAIELHRLSGSSWESTLETLVLALAEDRARLASEFAAMLRARPPTVFALPATDDEGACLQCAEIPCVGGHS